MSGSAEGPNASPPAWTIAGGYTQVPDTDLQAIAAQARTFSSDAFAAGAALTAGGLPSISITGNGTYTFTAANAGVHTFTGLVLRKKGYQTDSVTDTHNSAVKGSTLVDVL